MKMENALINEPKVIYCDFDGTITKEDSVNKFLRLFAAQEWLEVEEKWVNGEINSKECLSAQVDLIPKLSTEEFFGYIDSIEIDDYFIEFYNSLKRQNIELIILSDGFDLFIEETLKKHNLNDVKYFSNTLIMKNNKLSIEFKNGNPSCTTGSGVCKCSKAQEENFWYIGDGLSDACISHKAGKLFAKNSLKKYCDQKEIDYIKFETFKDILAYFAEKGDLNAKFNYINNRR